MHEKGFDLNINLAINAEDKISKIAVFTVDIEGELELIDLIDWIAQDRIHSNNIDMSRNDN